MDCREKQSNMGNCIGDALYELKKLQDFLAETTTPFLGKILGKLVGSDTIPFILLTNNGMFEWNGVIYDEKTKKEECFTTSFFRVDDIDKDSSCAKLTILRPYNIHKEHAKLLCDVVKLEKTPICVEVDISCFCGIQCLDTELLKRKIICEPKW
ncbi:CotY/CotZ family spore coat protein [Bacillus sp. FJAT-27251]|uniref:CotY/CotZ family spore coat protein n=1 Tax=Bacillus sp. FJAT-27251 TaxID=1684142 RepID=UPI0006A78B34|nr:CotY/CotZ family spore coat protein [Bacillus sp. FJAT-27251]